MKLKNQRSMPTVLWFAACIACMWMNIDANAQGFTTTTVQGTVYLANGQPGSGTLQLSWPAFTTASNQAVAAGRTNATIGRDGYVSVKLAPNQGATPAGLYYTAVYHLSDGTTSTEYWVVPAAAQASIGQIRAQVMPASQAVQAVSKGYVDQSITELTQSLLTASGGSLTGPLFLNGDPTQPVQAATKRYVDNEFANSLPLSGGVASGPLTSVQLGAAYQVDQFPGVDFGAKLQACLNRLDAVFGGTCDARNFTGSQTVGSTIMIATANATVQLPCATISTSNQIRITAGTRNVTFHGCALRGASNASGSQGGTVLLYSGTGPMIQVGDLTYTVDTLGFHIDNMVINTTASTNGAAQGMAAYRTQELNLEGLYLLGNSNQTGMTLDGTGNYTGGTFQDIEFNGFGTSLNGVGHQVDNAAATDWVNASTFVRLHINCPISNGSPMSGTYGINLVSGDGNTFTGGDVEGCGTALHLGPNAQNNTIVGLRNENSINQVVADAGSSYNNWMTGGTMFNGQLTDNGTRNSFLDTFHRSFNGLNGDWYGSQTDATITNHYRIGTGTGNERGLLNRYQSDYGYRWTTGLSDASAGQQVYQVLDELNNVYRLSIGQYNHGQGSTNNQTVINAAGTGAVVLNGSANAGTGGVIVGSGGATGSTVATINNAGSAQFNGSLQVGGASTFLNSTTVKNQADAEIDNVLWAGSTANQKESFIYKDFSGASQWYMVKDANNNWALNSAIGGLNSFKAYQSSNSGDTYVNASNGSGHIRLNYEPGAGSETDIYSGPSSTLVAAFLGNTAIKFPGLAAGSGRNCLQIDNSGYISNTGSGCATAGMNGTVSTGNAGQVAYYTANGTVIGGTSSVGVSSGGTGATTSAQALQNLGAQPSLPGVAPDGASGMTVGGNVAAGAAITAPQIGGILHAARYGDGSTNGIAIAATGANNQTVVADPSYANTEHPSPAWFAASPFHYSDQRLGHELDYFHNPEYHPNTNQATFQGFNLYNLGIQAGKSIYCLYDQATTYTASNMKRGCLNIGLEIDDPGWNIGNPGGFSSPAGGGWSVNGNLFMSEYIRGTGISESLGIEQTKTGVGDNFGGYVYVHGYGGKVAASDEGTGAMGFNVDEPQQQQYQASCTSGCTAGSNSMKLASAGGAQGVGHYAINTSAGAVYTCHYDLVNNNFNSSMQNVHTTDCTFPVSNAWGTTTDAINAPIANSPPFTSTQTFSVNVTGGAFDATHLMCFVGTFHEQFFPTSVSLAGSVATITANLRHQHGSGSVVFQGGMCGKGVEWSNYTFNGIQYLIDVYGSTDASTVQVGFYSGTGLNAQPLSAGVAYQTINLTNATASSETTVSFVATNAGTLYHPWTLTSGGSIVITGADDPALNAACTSVLWTDTTHGTCTIAGLSGMHTTTAAPIATMGQNTLKFYDMAEVIDVLNRTTSPPSVDGTMTFEPNTMWVATNDTVTITHHISGMFKDLSLGLFPTNPWGSFLPLRLNATGRGVVGGGNFVSSSQSYVNNANNNPDTYYYGAGGNLTPPNVWNNSGAYFNAQLYNEGPSNEAAWLYLMTTAAQNTNPTYNYYLYELVNKSGIGYNSMSVNPYTGNTMDTVGGTRTMSSTGMVNACSNSANNLSCLLVQGSTPTGAGTTAVPFLWLRYINASTVSNWNANGTQLGIQAPSSYAGLFMDFRVNNGASVFSVDAAGKAAMGAGSTVGGVAIPTTAFVGSGASHSQGLVPDPGSLASTLKYLREDGTWNIPAGSGTSSILVFRDATNHNVNSAASETVLYSAAIPGGTMSATGKLDINGVFTSTSTATQTCSYKVYLNSSAGIGGAPLLNYPNLISGGSRHLDFRVQMWNRNAINAQFTSQKGQAETGTAYNGTTTSSVNMGGTEYIVVTATPSSVTDPVGCSLEVIDGVVTQ